MADTTEHSADAITEDEIAGGAPQAAPKNAFAELMSPKKSKPSSPGAAKSNRAQSLANGTPTTSAQADPQASLNAFYGRDALAAYTRSPSSFPSPSRVLRYDEHFVVIHDVYPKSSMHLLLLPRDARKSAQHPFDAFEDAAFRDSVLAQLRPLRKLAAAELRRRWGRLSASERARDAALDAGADEGDDGVPPGRDWEASVLSGVHAFPSMNHLHVHVLSVDRVSEAMRHRKHYNSFATPFLVPVEDFPLASDDPRRHPGRQGYLDREMLCWRCGKNFGNKFAALKRHLEEEFEQWKRE